MAALRARRDLTQEKLAEKIGVSARYIQNVEAGEYFPSPPTPVRLRAVPARAWTRARTFRERAGLTLSSRCDTVLRHENHQ